MEITRFRVRGIWCHKSQVTSKKSTEHKFILVPQKFIAYIVSHGSEHNIRDFLCSLLVPCDL